jgi:hypothetical protein
MLSIENIHTNFFTRVFSEVANVATFLKVTLPEELQNRLDLTEMALDATSYVSEEYRSSNSSR